MWGAIIGDLAGSIYEYDQTKKVTPVNINNLIEKSSFYSDDTILTIAMLDAFLNDKNSSISTLLLSGVSTTINKEFS